ncbi:CBS domain-containing protein [Clostridium oryzae]|uniref:Hypoxic response protein 1 n=1 Tax=Clostridium oryzae TaxID=1450648 RepID=A0A1V4IJK4_9CLOT|nr:CBS domain-containing protein [Clostridium oryzae]OPJ60116.1 hypoxic response protein 1 [Clostridium oryzae]
MKLRDVMTKNATFLNVNDNIEKAAQIMKDQNIGSVPVCEGNKVVGIVTDRDITIRATAAENKSNGETNVRSIMTSNPVTASPDMDVHEAAKIMSDKQIRRLPVVENNSLVGMVALGDLATDPLLSDNAGEALKNISEPYNVE